jgi:hypothetical protein
MVDIAALIDKTQGEPKERQPAQISTESLPEIKSCIIELQTM